MQGMTNPTIPPPPHAAPAPRRKPFYETTLGGIVIALVLVAGLLFAAYVWYVNSSDDSVTVDCTYDSDSASCTRY